MKIKEKGNLRLSSRKKFIISAVITSVVLISIYTLIMFIFAARENNRYTNSFENNLSEYKDMLSNASEEAIEDITIEDGFLAYPNIIDPSIAVALYHKRVDDTATYYTRDEFLSRDGNKSVLPAHLELVMNEKIGGLEYKTYSFKYNDNYYIKLFMRYDNSIIKDNKLDVLIFTLIIIGATAVIITVCMVALYIPILDNISKQKEFINDISHEIRTPLTVIRGNLENILAKPNSTIMETGEYIENAINEVEHITNLSQNLLSIVSDKRSLLKKSSGFTLNESISSVLEIYSEIISGENKTLIANISQVSTVCDVEKIKQLLIILLENAIKYTRESDKIKITLKPVNKGFTLSVADTGIGIADGEEVKIFQRFYRGDNARQKQGSGLGLSIAKNIVENHNGKITATHNIPSGLVVTAYIEGE